MRERIDALAAWDELDVDAAALPSQAVRLSDASVIDALAEVTALANHAGRLQAVLAGVASQRSRREDGHAGLAAVRGHASPASLIQSITGGTKAEATRQVRVGVSLLECVGAPHPGGGLADDRAPAPPPWHDSLRAALLSGVLTSAQHDAIRGGLGEPAVDDDTRDADAVRDAWTLASRGLIDEASAMPVEELAKRARTMRDLLDPTGAESRFARRYESRSYRRWIDADGQRHARIAYDDEMGLWVDAMLAAALRPRRGGPRFVTADERAAAEKLQDDPRTNDQLAYDLLMDVLRAGSLATAPDVYGARQPGVRVITVDGITGPRDPLGRLLGMGHAEDGGDALPGSVIDRNVCVAGTVRVAVDPHGNPLDVGREQRLFTPRQRLALAARDGGCRWPSCTRPASYCEAHHCDPYSEGGATDIDRGILLCRHHHMALHNQGARITRDGLGEFLIHPPGGGAPSAMPTKAAWKWAWDPPPPPDRRRWRAG
ncbi:HNH endonuclease signature motif containing protein [Microbacterium rhizomatis]|nr:HNH endonuclease signature motif containing protein [Microbacterium rhizomatis]